MFYFMILKNIFLKNIRSYTNCEFNFKEGINFLSGDIGHGKSTILMAIEFSLFGFIRGNLEGIDLLRKGEKVGAVVVCFFDYEKNLEIKITRIIRNKDNSIVQDRCEIELNKNIEVLSSNELNFKIYEIFNFPKEFLRKDKNLIYRFINYTPQESLKQILFSKEEERLEIIRKIFDIDKYKKIQNSIEIYQKKIREDEKIQKALSDENKVSLKNLKDEVFEDPKLIDEKIQKCLEKDKVLKDNFQKIRKLKENFESKNNKVLKDEININKKINAIQNSENNLERLKPRFIEIKSFLRVNNLDNLDDNIKKLEEEKIRVKKNIENLDEKKLNEELLSLRKDLEKLENELVENKILDEKIKNLKLNLDKNLEKNIKDKKSKQIILEDNIKNLEKDVSDKKQLEDDLKKFEKKLYNYKYNFEDLLNKNLNDIEECPFCFQKVSQSHIENFNKEKNSRIKNLKLEIEKNEIEKDKISKILKNKEDYKKELDDKSYELKTLKSSIEDLKKKFLEQKELDEDIKSLEEKKKSFNLDNNKLVEIKNKILEKENKIKQTYDKKVKLNGDLNDLIFKIENLKNVKEETFKKQEELKNVEKEILENQNIINNNKNTKEEILKIKNQKKDLENQKIKIENLNQNLNDKQIETNNFLNALNTSKDKLLEKEKRIKDINLKIESHEKEIKKLLDLNNFLNEFKINFLSILEKKLFRKYYFDFNEIFKKNFFELIDEEYLDIKIDENFSPVVFQNGFEANTKTLSGGEKSALAISFRLALKQIIQDNINKTKLNFLILDEPSDGFSQSQISKFGNLLKNLNFNQVLLVSHDNNLGAISNNLIKIEKKDHETFIV